MKTFFAAIITAGFLLAVVMADVRADIYSEMASCACPLLYQPVCGSDDVTYSNGCVLNCAMATATGTMIGLKKRRSGSCDETKLFNLIEKSVIHLEYDSVNNLLDFTLLHSVLLSMSGVWRFDKTKKMHRVSVLILTTVILLGSLLPTSVEGRLSSERGICACPRIYMPVCGTDLHTYSNECSLRCEANSDLGRANGLKKLQDGACDTLADNLEELPVEY
ncbi:serine protease inhibitor dipetalogastin-like [Wyeomyia smithii]|uniref:serine protease inhibitor dipetalogastin-like n=1 Tax=Wyeomyia smithii TaxID=174621 RepID=UPI002468175A|nr:serine protease inhibitor dipetalogastin-like [Wyeomyia smithii]